MTVIRAMYSLALLSAVMAACTAQQGIERQQSGASNAAMFSEGDAYERFMGRWSRQLAPVFLKFVELEGGASVLDVGSGTGALTAAVLSTNEPSRVIGVDPSSVFVNYARSKTTDGRATFEEGDGQRLRFANESFDATVSLLVINFIPDPRRALREMIRVTRRGGIVAAAVWDYDEGMEMLRVFWDEAVDLDPSSAARDERHMPFSRAGELAALWREHGLIDVREAPLVIPLTFQSFEEYWSPFLERQGPAGAYISALSEGPRAELAERLRRRLQGQGVGPIRLRGRAWAVRGVVAD